MLKPSQIRFPHVASFDRALGYGRAVRFALALSGCIFGSAAPARAQVLPLLKRPNVYIADNAYVYSSARLPDGSMVFGGTFSAVEGVPRSYVFKRRPDGTLDPDWNPSVDSRIAAIASDSSGNVYIGGSFRTVNGVERRGLAKLSGDGVGTLDADWNPSTSISGTVNALLIDASDNVYVGGYFSQMGGAFLYNLAKLSSSGTGAADPNWEPDPNVEVKAMALDADGNLFVGGSFSEIGGWQQRNIAKVSSVNGAVDRNWNPITCEILALAVDSAGGLFAGGGGLFADGCVHKLSRTGTGAFDPNWQPSFSEFSNVNALAVDADGNIWVGGSFWNIGGAERRHVAKLSASDATVDPDFNPSPTEEVRTIAFGADGKAYIGGDFDGFGGLTRLALAVVSPTGEVEAPMDVERPGSVSALARQPDGGTIVGGDFMKADGYSRHNLLRLRADGTVDPDWNPSPDHWVDSLAIDAVGRVYVGGSYFNTIGGQPRNGLARLSGSGTGEVDPDWNPQIGSFGPDALVFDAAGDLYMAGIFGTVDGLPRKNVAKMLTSGSGEVDPDWNPTTDSYINALALDATGHLYIGGAFRTVGAAPRNRIARVSASGTGELDPDWKPSASDVVYSLAINSSGEVFVGGDFTSIDGLPRKGIAKLSSAGTVDPTWNPAADDRVSALAIDAAGDVYAGGRFTTIGGQPRERVARLSGSGTGEVAADWKPSVSGEVKAVLVDPSGNVGLGGSFRLIDGERRIGVAAFGEPVVLPDFVFVDGFESPARRSIDAEG